MTSTTQTGGRWTRPLIAAAAAGIIGWIAFGAHHEVPGLDQFDLAIHETGHLLTAFMPRLVMFMAGSAAQVLFPLTMAAYFGLQRRDLAAAGFCLTWAGTSARDVSIYAGDAVRQALPLIGGGEHDWAYILGHRGFDALQHTAAVARSIELAGLSLAVTGIIVALWAGIGRPTESVAAHAVRSTVGDREAWVAASSLPFRHGTDDA